METRLGKVYICTEMLELDLGVSLLQWIYIFIRGAKEVVANRVFCYSAKKKKGCSVCWNKGKVMSFLDGNTRI